MEDKYRIDSHKLIFHPKRVSEWLDAQNNWELSKKVYPIYVELSPVGYCNHRCRFCALDFVKYQNRQLDAEILKNRLSEMVSLGIKSVMFAGEGEPTLYKELPEIIEHCSNIGIDTSLTTNFSFPNDENTEVYIKNCKWIKVSINAGTPENYAYMHRVSENEFHKVINHIKKAIEIRKQKNYKCTIGTQILLVEDNYHTATQLAETMSQIGVDYLVIKPYSQHLESITDTYKNTDYSKFLNLNEELKKFNTDKFKIIFRINTIDKLIHPRPRYKVCQAVPFFWAHIMSNGEVYGCSSFFTNDNFKFGNIHESSFKEVWESQRRKECLEYLQKMDIKNCRINCRMDEINYYLWELKHPSEHVNFI